MLKRAALVGVGALVVAVVAVGLAFAGSSGQIAAGVKISGVDVGGLKPKEAERLLRKRYAAFAASPLVVTAGPPEFPPHAPELRAPPHPHPPRAKARGAR